MVELVRRTHAVLHTIDDEFAMWTDYDLEVRGDSTIDYDLSLGVRFDAEAGQTVLADLRVVRRLNGREVRGAGLRALRLQDYVRATPSEVMWPDGGGKWSGGGGDRLRAQLVVVRADPTAWQSSRLAWVYRLYRVAELAMLDPAREVARALELNPRTATRWIGEAREAGYFGTPTTELRRTMEVPGDAAGEFAPVVTRVSEEELHGDG